LAAPPLSPSRSGFASGDLPNPTAGDCFNLAAFPVVTRRAYRFGNSGRNIIDGDASTTVNAAVTKSFPLLERRCCSSAPKPSTSSTTPTSVYPCISPTRKMAGAFCRPTRHE